MSHVVTEVAVDDDTLARLHRPRRGLVREREVAPGVFEAVTGPVSRYRRTVTVAGGRARQEVDYRLAVPFFGFLFAVPARRRLGTVSEHGWQSPWWGPPDTLDGRAAALLASLAVLSMVGGYLGTLLTQTITFAAREFDADRAAQGVALAAVRFDVLATIAVVAAADRRGRRKIALLAVAAGSVLTVTGALAPGLAWLAGSQVAARGFVTAAAITVGVLAAEEMPAGSRAYAISLLAMAGALGAGVCVMLLPIADLATAAWRILYLVPLGFLPVIAAASRHLPESRRFRRPHADAPIAGHGRRFWLLAVSAFLLAVFTAPASQFQNDYLRTERGYSAGRIALFTLLTNTPGGIGIIVGGRLADTKGRRPIGAIGLVGGVGATVLMYVTVGWPLWMWSVVGAIVGAAVVPALGVYGPELFPTSLRGRANGVITGLGRVGSVIGLLAAGFLSRSFGTIGPALAILALGPLLLAILVLVAYPETAHVELEDLNPEDREPTRAPTVESP